MFSHINVWVDMLRSPVCVPLPIVTQPTGNWIMGGNLDGKTRLTNYWQRLQQKHILIWSPCCIPPSGIFYVGHFISKWTLGASLFWRLLWDLIAEKKSKLTMIGHYQSAQSATAAYNRSAPEDSLLLPILEPKTDEGRISNAGWRKGHPAEGRCPYFHRLPPCCCFWGC